MMQDEDKFELPTWDVKSFIYEIYSAIGLPNIVETAKKDTDNGLHT